MGALPPPRTRPSGARFILPPHITQRFAPQSLLFISPSSRRPSSMPSFALLAVLTLLSGAATAAAGGRHGSDILLRRGSTSNKFLCLAFNLNNSTGDGAPLIRSANSGPGLQCTYSDGDQCTYTSGNGSIQPGSKTCPPSTDAFKSTGAHFDCQQTDLQESPLIGTSMTPTAENLACVYADSALCTYSQFTGTLSTGAGNCPLTAVSSAACPVSSTGPNPRTAASRNLLSSVDSASSKGKPSPAVIALITLNSVLVLAVLIPAGFWFTRLCWRAGTREAKYRSLSLGHVVGSEKGKTGVGKGKGMKGMKGMMGMGKGKGEEMAMEDGEMPEGGGDEDQPFMCSATRNMVDREPSSNEDQPFMCSAAPRA
ncbi:hypothetical protein C8R45DRAFT_196201 [Mycena sanguinolenta]|nr:hypothetical protein C8R45DRAFT_196201 [Mycena sanguinolenta]